MKKLAIIILVLVMTNSLYGQKIKNKISKSTCKCLTELVENGVTFDSDDPLEMCLQPLLIKYEKELRKEYGDNFFDDSGTALHDFGVTIGMILARDCDIFMQLVSDEMKNESNLSDSLYNQAESKIAEGQIKEAIDLYSQAIKIDPAKYDYFNSRGIANYRKGDFYKAIADFYRAMELEPFNHNSYYNCSYSMYQLGDMNSALKEINNAITLEKSFCDSYNVKGLIFDYQDQVDSSLVYFQKAHECDTGNVTFVYNLGYAKYRGRNYEEALQHFLEAYKVDTTHQKLINYIGVCYNNLNDYKNSLRFQNKSIALASAEEYIPLFNRGLTHFNHEAYELAYEDFQAAHGLDSTDQDVISYLARASYQLKNYQEALTHMNQLISEDTDNANYYDYRALINKELRLYEDAIRDYQVSLSLYPDDCKIHEYLGDLYTLINQEDKAEKSYQQSENMGCEEEEAMNN